MGLLLDQVSMKLGLMTQEPVSFYDHGDTMRYGLFFPCVICSNPFTDRHHLVPRKMFGLDSDDNTVYLCSNHHRMVHSLLDFEIFMAKGGLRKRRLEAAMYLSLFRYILAYENDTYKYFENCMKPAIYRRFLDVWQGFDDPTLESEEMTLYVRHAFSIMNKLLTEETISIHDAYLQLKSRTEMAEAEASFQRELLSIEQEIDGLRALIDTGC